MDYLKRSKLVSILLAVLVVAGIICGIAFGFKLGFAYEGGTLIIIDLKTDYDVNIVTKALRDNGINNAKVIKSGSDTLKTTADIRISGVDYSTSPLGENILGSIKAVYPGAELKLNDKVEGVSFKSIALNALLSFGIALVVAFIYVALRFRPLGGFTAIIIMLLDILITLSVTLILRISIDTALIASILLVAAFSLSNTIALFDRIKGHTKSAIQSKKQWNEIVNNCICLNIRRVIIMSLVLLVIAVLMCVIGGAGYRAYALPIGLGVLASTVTAVFITGALWAALQGKDKGTKTKVKTK